ncbi:hypothetical protein [Metamycoplasma equirhinis]|uniref:hypothetical protein n=1 Tax=Metamycoplasma equirhinis TaxID=92402 RepID=UPI00359C7BF1
MKKILNREFWVVFTTLNIIALMGYFAFSFISYEIVTGHIIGIISFIVFLMSIVIPTNFMFNIKNDAKSSKKMKAYAVMLFLIFCLCNLLIITLAGLINYGVSTIKEIKITMISPINLFVIPTPYIIFSIQTLVAFLKNYITNIKLKRREENGQNIKS